MTASTPAAVYLDHAATTPVRPEVIDVVAEVMRTVVGNPTGAHAAARRARHVVEESRDRVAAVLGVHPSEIVFCSGGTEADDLAVSGVVEASGGRPVCTAVEHPAVLEAVEAFGGTVVGVDETGVVDPDRILEAVGPDTAMVSVMSVNNEVGVVQPVERIAALLADHAPGVLLHTDAVQAVAWLDPSPFVAAADLASVSAHKVGGPQGVGCLVVREGSRLAPRHRGGGQERERRSGTHDVAGIAGMAAAMEAAAADRRGRADRITGLRDLLLDGLTRLEGASAPGASARSAGLLAPHVATVAFEGLVAEELLFLLDREGIAASGGSSCSSGALQVPHTLAAMGVPRSAARGAVRFSLGHTTTQADVDRVLEVLPRIVDHLRGSNPDRRADAVVGSPA